MSQSKNGIWGMVFYGAVLLALIGLLCYGLVAPASAQEDSRTLPILMYHDIVPEGGRWTTTRPLWRSWRQTCRPWPRRLANRAPFGGHRLCAHGSTAAEKPVLLVFDDGYRSILTQVRRCCKI